MAKRNKEYSGQEGKGSLLKQNPRDSTGTREGWVRLQLEVLCRRVKSHQPCHSMHIEWPIASFPVRAIFSKEFKQKYREVRLSISIAEWGPFLFFFFSGFSNLYKGHFLVAKALKWSLWSHIASSYPCCWLILNVRETCLTEDKRIKIKLKLAIEEVVKVEKIFPF